MIKYRHYRHLSEVTGQINSRGGATLAYTDNGDGTFVGAVAYCHPKDNYNKSYGRAKAAGRLKKNSAHNFSLTDDDKYFRIETSDPKEFLQILDDTMALYNLEPR